jgi:glyoxylase-like metal-dependent hydrolase (beta-lactamase superfamily II)
MNIKNIVVGEYGVNCFVLWNENNKAVVIDPGYDAEQIIKFLAENSLDVAAYILTHGHMDHISALAEVYDANPAPVGMHAEDQEWAFSDINQALPLYPTPRAPAKIERSFDDDQAFCDGGLSYRVITTPGHTPGGVCFYFYDDGTVFTGDTLFAGSVGRTDLHKGDSRILKQSLNKLCELDESTVVYPGHGPATRIGHEKRTNFFMQ